MKTLKLIIFFSFALMSNLAYSAVDAPSAYNAIYTYFYSQSSAWQSVRYFDLSHTGTKQYIVYYNTGLQYATSAAWNWTVDCSMAGQVYNTTTHLCTAPSPVCVLPQVLDNVTNTCITPKVCTAGEQKNISIPMGSYPPPGTPPTIKLTQDLTSVTNVLPTVIADGCVYTIPLNASKTGCFTTIYDPVTNTSNMYCNTVATKTGSIVLGADTAKLATTNTDTPVPSAKSGCILTSQGNEICNTSPTQNCGTVNGTSVCFKDGALQSNGLPATIVNGQVVGTTTNANGQVERCANGGYSAGGTTCINLPNLACGPGTAFVCMQPEGTTSNPNPLPVPISNDPVTVTKHATVTHPDNSRTVTDTTTRDVVGESPYQQTQEFDVAGNLIQTTYTGAIVGNNGGVSTAPGDGSDEANIGVPGAAFPGSDLSGIDGAFSSATTAMTNAAGGISASNFLGTAPVPQSSGSTCQTVPMFYKSLHYTFDPCGKLAMFREMFAYMLYILTAYSIYEIAVRPYQGA